MFFKRKTNLRTIHQVYLVLSHALPEKEEDYLIDELETMMEKAKPGTVLKVLEIMCPNEIKEKSGLLLFLLFIRKLRESNFFEYANFIKGLKRG